MNILDWINDRPFDGTIKQIADRVTIDLFIHMLTEVKYRWNIGLLTQVRECLFTLICSNRTN